MTEEFIVHLFREALYTMLLVSAPILIMSLIVGLVISIFQAATSIQEFTLTFIPKIVITGLIIVLLFPWMIDILVTFTKNLINQIPTLIN